jgi:hypothetical protein
VVLVDVGEQRQIARIELPLVRLELALDRPGYRARHVDYKGPIRITDVFSGPVKRCATCKNQSRLSARG